MKRRECEPEEKAIAKRNRETLERVWSREGEVLRASVLKFDLTEIG